MNSSSELLVELFGFVPSADTTLRELSVELRLGSRFSLVFVLDYAFLSTGLPLSRGRGPHSNKLVDFSGVFK